MTDDTGDQMARTGRGRTVLLLAGLVTGLTATAVPPPAGATGAGAVASPPAGAGDGQARVLVREHPGQGGAAAAAVRRLGGRVTTALPLVEGFAATVPAGALAALSAAPGVAGVAPDAPVTVSGGPDDAQAVAEPERPLAPTVVRAPKAWAAGVTGRGVTVALLDTGVAPSPDLAGRVVRVDGGLLGADADCYDLSGEGTCADSYGHGTFMAGLVAGDGRRSGGRAIGAAPGARVLSVKVAGRSGASDVSTVLAGIQWVVAHRDVYGIDVLNLSLGTGSTTSWRYDPLNYAVERAWDAGIVVVTAAANRGPAAQTIAKPGDDPLVVTVGATDSLATVGLGDDRVPDFSSRGPTRDGLGKPDLVAPGGRVLSLQAAGSTLQRMFPTSASGTRYRPGSGTSMATAVVSGTAALVLQRHPAMTPDRVKHVLSASARPVAATRERTVVGAGMVDAATAVLRPPPGVANAGVGRSNGRGDLAASRGTHKVTTDGPVPLLLQGRMTAQLLLWEAEEDYLGAAWTPAGWSDSVHATAGWNTLRWAEPAGHDWTGHDWVGHDWTGSSWQGEHEGRTDYGRAGQGSASYGAWG